MPTNYQDISRKTTNVIFDPEVSGEIIARAQEQSAVMQLASRMTIAPNGNKFQTITGDPAPEWVAETNDKPVDFFTFGTKTVIPYKMALIVPFSMEFRRDKDALYNECIRRVPALFGKKFDATAMSTSARGTPDTTMLPTSAREPTNLCLTVCNSMCNNVARWKGEAWRARRWA